MAALQLGPMSGDQTQVFVESTQTLLSSPLKDSFLILILRHGSSDNTSPRQGCDKLRADSQPYSRTAELVAGTGLPTKRDSSSEERHVP